MSEVKLIHGDCLIHKFTLSGKSCYTWCVEVKKERAFYLPAKLHIPDCVSVHTSTSVANQSGMWSFAFTEDEMPKGVYSNSEARAKKISDALKRGAAFGCLVCGKTFWRKPYAIKRGENKFCTRACYFKWQKGKKKIVSNPANGSGTNNPNWKGGITPENKKIRGSNKYLEWRADIFERDDWTCRGCGARSGAGHYVRIEAHHIKPFAIFPGFRFEIDNGLTLCKNCHDKEAKGRQIYQGITA